VTLQDGLVFHYADRPRPKLMSTQSFIRVPLTEHHYETAEKRQLSYNSNVCVIGGEKASPRGSLGEVVLMEYLHQQGVDFTEDFTYYQDLTITNSGPLEVKTKSRNVSPRLNYEASIPTYSHKFQNVNYWAFVSLQQNKEEAGDTVRCFHTAYLVGVANRRLLEHPLVKTVHAGDYDPSNNLTLQMTTINMTLDLLKPTAEAAQIWLERQESPF